MKPQVQERLLQLNHQFYQTFAESFSQTRQRLQPGVLRALDGLPPGATILDIGCGNGGVAKELARRAYAGTYVGIDLSEKLLEQAATLKSTANLDVSFAVLHHLPGVKLRLQTLRTIHEQLTPQARFIHSNWQFLNSPRLRKRIQPWEAIELKPDDVDPGDYLLDWRRDGHGLRYIHHFSESELVGLANQTGFMVVETFYSDGEGGKLGLYQVWERSISRQ